MAIPVPAVPTTWTALEPDAKRERVLRAAADVFARDGLDAPMPAVAAAAGAGVASLYRQFPSKQDLLAELVVRRLDWIAEGAERTLAQGGERWPALTGLLTSLVERQGCDEFLGEAMARVEDHPAVRLAVDRATESLDRLLVAARAEGRLRADATTFDLRLLFAATRAARRVGPGAERRMLELLVDALDAAHA